MESDDDFDYDEYREQVTDQAVEGFRQRMEPGDEAYNELTEAVFEVADEWIGYRASMSEIISLLDESPHEPEDWEHLAEGKDDWRDVIRAMAFTVVRQDVYDGLEANGYLDSHWNPSPKLTEANSCES